MQVDPDRLWRYHEAGKLRHSVDLSGSKHVWSYSPSTVFSRDWDDLTLLCRGLVTTDEGVVLSRPFPKFFNWGEPEAPSLEVTSKPFWAYDKEDGSLIVVGLDDDGEPVVSTKGSFNTWHSTAAREMLAGWKPVEGSTAIFEFIHPANRIVLNYDGYEGLILLGAVANEDGCDHFSPEQYAQESGWFGDLAKPRMFNLQTMLRTVSDPANGPNREGFVIVWPNPDGPSPRVKVKYQGYIELHARLSGLSNVAVWEALSNGTLDPLLEAVPDEMYTKVRECADELIRSYTDAEVAALAHAEHARNEFDNRRDQADWIRAESARPGLVFAALDGKEIGPRVWAAIKPKRDAKWNFLN